MRRRKRNEGFTLIEVLVSMAIIAVGLLGLAGIQAMIVSNTATSRVRSVAAMLAENLSGAMGANNVYWSGSPPATVTATGSMSASTCDSTWATTTLSDTTLQGLTTDCNSSTCSDGAAVAAYDLKYWGCQVATQLPSGTGEVACATTAAGPVACTITVKWIEKNAAYKQSAATAAATPGTAQTYQVVTQP